MQNINTIETKPNYLIWFFTIFAFASVVMFLPFESTFVLLLLGTILLMMKNLNIGVLFLILSFTVTKKILIYFLGFEPPLIIFYPFILAVLILFYQNIVHSSILKFQIGKYDLILIFFSLYLLFSLFFFSGNRDYGGLKYQFYLSSVILFYIPMIYKRKEMDYIRFHYTIFYFGIVLAILGLIQLFGVKQLFERSYSGRFNILGINPIWIGRYLSYAILVELYIIRNFLKDKKSNIGKIILLSGIMLFQLLLIFMTGSRGPLFGLIAAFAFVYFSYHKIKFSKLASIFAVVFIILMLVFYFVPKEMLGRITGTEEIGHVTIGIRILANLSAIDMFLSSKIFGIGFGAYAFGGEILQRLSYPHNIFTEILAETGLIGFFLLIYIIFSPLINFYKKRKIYNKNFYVLVISIYIAAFINANLSGHIGANYYLWFSLGIMYAMNTEAKQKRDIKDSSKVNIQGI